MLNLEDSFGLYRSRLTHMSLPVRIPKDKSMMKKSVAKAEITRPIAERIPQMNMVVLVLNLSLNKLAMGPKKRVSRLQSMTLDNSV